MVGRGDPRPSFRSHRVTPLLFVPPGLPLAVRAAEVGVGAAGGGEEAVEEGVDGGVDVVEVDGFAGDEEADPEGAEQEVDGEAGVRFGRDLTSGYGPVEDVEVEAAAGVHGLGDDVDELRPLSRFADEPFE